MVRIAINIATSIVILALGVLCLKLFGQKPEIEKQESDRNQAPLVETTEVTEYNEPIMIELDGEASTFRVLTVSSEVTGKVISKPVNRRGGNYINKGDLLFEIDPTTYQLQVDQLNAQIEQIKAELQSIDVDATNTQSLVELAEEDLRLQQSLLARTKSLYERKGSTESALENAMKAEIASRNAVLSLQNQIRAYEQTKITKNANLKLVKTQLDRAQVDLDRCTILSPIEGRLVDDLTEQGDYVKPGDELVHISDGSKMEVKCQMLAEELAWVWQEQMALNQSATAPVDSNDPIKFIAPVPCEVVFEFEGVETIWDGFLDRYEGTGIDRETRTFPCRVLVEKPQQTRTSHSLGGRSGVTPPTLLSGMYVSVRIPIESSVQLLEVPLEAVRPGEMVWLVNNQKLQIVDVTVAKTKGDKSLIRQGLGVQAGNRVVTSPLASVSNNMPVRETERPNGEDTVAPETKTRGDGE